MPLTVVPEKSNPNTGFSVSTDQVEAGNILFKVVIGDGLNRPDFSDINNKLNSVKKDGGDVPSVSKVSFDVSDSSCPAN